MSDAVSTLLEAILAEPPERRTVAMETACVRHPELATVLRARLRIVESLGLLDDQAAPTLSVPERLGDFRLLERLGGGGMGIVYRARQESLGREVAVKLVRPELLLFERSRARFLREVEAVARLSHPGVVPIHAFGEAQGIPFFAMELLHGASLSQALGDLAASPPAARTGADLAAIVARRAGTPAAPPALGDSWTAACAQLVLRVAEALAHAHGHGVVHRDVKPSNIMLAADGRVLLVDFGIAGAEGAEPLTRSGAQLGSLQYSAPEQLQGVWGLVDGRADLFSLGCVLYELLAGHAPFRAPTDRALLQQILLRDPPDLQRANRAVPADLAAIVDHLLEKDLTRRYASAARLAEDLRAFLGYRPVSVRRPGPVGRFLRWRRREPWRAALVLGAVPAVLLVAALAGYLAASWPEIAAGRAALREDQVELALAEGFTEFAHGDRGRARSAFARAAGLAPERREAKAALALAGETAASRPSLSASAPASAPARVATDPVACFVEGLAASARLWRGDAVAARAAARWFEDAVALAPRARLLFHIGLARGAELAGDAALARRAAAGLLALWPQIGLACYWAGRALLEHDAQGAVAALRAATALAPGSPYAWADLGVAAQRAGDSPGALSAYTQALALDPRNGQVLLDLALLQLASGNKDAAASLSRRAVECAPELPGAHYARGLVLLASDDADQALQSFLHTTELAPDYAEAWNNLGSLRFRAGDGRGAVVAFRHFAALRPTAVQAHQNLALALWQTGDLRGAARTLQRVVELAPADAQAHQDLCTLLEHLGEKDALAREQARFAGRQR